MALFLAQPAGPEAISRPAALSVAYVESLHLAPSALLTEKWPLAVTMKLVLTGPRQQMQKLEIYQSHWAMELRHPKLPERSNEENFAMVAEAGFHGMCLDYAVADLEYYAPMRPLFDKYHLGCMVNAFPHTAAELNPVLQMAKDFNACIVNVIGGVMPISYTDAVPVLYQWLDEAAAMNMRLLIETHRNGTLNDLYYTLQVLDAMPELRLCADLSHFVVDREFELPLSERDAGFMHRILQRSDCFQGRVANREQVQIQIDFPQHREWVDQFKNWWRDGMRLWRQRNPTDATLHFLCELGPPSYAITDARGYELSDRWQEALTIKSWVEEIWSELEAEDGASPG
ncbi:MAG: sugar phosphate isomerase/epimerase family protein [Pseudomonadales bacterium]